MAEAEALAKAASSGKLATRAHAKAIDKLRARWKELDKLGGATSKKLWEAFDGALKTAYAPVAAQLEKLKLARSENLAVRNQLIESLNEAKAKLGSGPPHLRALARAVEDAKLAWRKLGPVEHTVPREAQKGEQAVSTRFTGALHALEAPLAQAYRDAPQERERLVAAAKSLTESTLARDAITKVRALQANGRSMPRLCRCRGARNTRSGPLSRPPPTRCSPRATPPARRAKRKRPPRSRRAKPSSIP